VRVQAPVRVLDAGGWTDTWFAGHGEVCNLAVSPGSEVLAVMESRRAGPVEVRLRVPDYEDEYTFSTDDPPGRHPLLEAVLRRWAPPRCALEVDVSSAVPAGSSLGTSAAVVVGLIGALQALAGTALGPEALAHAAHDIETIDLGRQSGVQDQVAAAFGGVNLVHIDPYPRFAVRALDLAPTTMAEVGRRAVTVHLGGAHDSSALHGSVIQRLAGDEREAARLVEPLRRAALRAADALLRGDLEEYGEALVDNTAAQAALHPDLVSPLARRVAAAAAEAGALGWKVNGAGGHGGSMSIIAPEEPKDLVRALEDFGGLTVLPLHLAPQGACVVDRG
jgi:D-glycero-alpha-D-manno-heptose-7-phosphate kinase